MGQMKSLYQAEAELIERAGVFYMHRTATLQAKCKDVLDRIRTAEFLIGDFLEEGWTTDLFAARSILIDAIKLLEGPDECANRASQPTNDSV